MKKNVLIAVLICIIVVLSIQVSISNSNVDLRNSNIIGFYQDVNVRPDNMVQLTFDRDNKYIIYLDSKTFSEGTYVKLNDHSYILKQSNESTHFFILSEKCGYLVLPEIRSEVIFEVKKNSDVPTYIDQEAYNQE